MRWMQMQSGKQWPWNGMYEPDILHKNHLNPSGGIVTDKVVCGRICQGEIADQ